MRSKALRDALSETRLSVEDLLLPIFVQEGGETTSVDSMPGVKRLGNLLLKNLTKEIKIVNLRNLQKFQCVYTSSYSE